MLRKKTVEERWVSITELAKNLKVDKSTAQRRVTTAINRGFLKNLEDKQGVPARIVLDEKMPEDECILPKLSLLKKRIQKQ